MGGYEGEHEMEAPPTTGTKAVVGAIVSGVVAFLSTIVVALQAVGPGATFGQVDAATWLTAVIAALAGGGVTGGGVYWTTNRLKP